MTTILYSLLFYLLLALCSCSLNDDSWTQPASHETKLIGFYGASSVIFYESKSTRYIEGYGDDSESYTKCSETNIIRFDYEKNESELLYSGNNCPRVFISGDMLYAEFDGEHMLYDKERKSFIKQPYSVRENSFSSDNKLVFECSDRLFDEATNEYSFQKMIQVKFIETDKILLKDTVSNCWDYEFLTYNNTWTLYNSYGEYYEISPEGSSAALSSTESSYRHIKVYKWGTIPIVRESQNSNSKYHLQDFVRDTVKLNPIADHYSEYVWHTSIDIVEYNQAQGLYINKGEIRRIDNDEVVYDVRAMLRSD